jgi:hypothetical protein
LRDGSQELRAELFAVGHDDLVRAEPAVGFLFHRQALDRMSRFPRR